MKSLISLALASISLVALAQEPVNRYVPIPGGWEVYLSQDPGAKRLPPGSEIGVIDTEGAGYGAGHAFATTPGKDNPRLHRRPLYPPADKSLIWTEAEREKMAYLSFRPMVLAYNEPRFLFDLHSAGGLLGHLQLGLVVDGGAAKWFHNWSDLKIRYVDGRMTYEIKDADFPGVTMHIEAAALSESVGLILKVRAEGLTAPAQLVWAYGGASAFFTNYAFTAPEFVFSPAQCAKDDVSWENGKQVFTLARGFDKSDVFMTEPFAVARHIPEWKAQMQGGSSWEGKCGFGKPEAFTASPAELANSAQWVAGPANQKACVAVQSVPMKDGTEGYVAVGMGGDIAAVLANPATAWDAALVRNSEIASRVTVETPDPWLNSAMPMMAFATDGTWGETAMVHGGWSWRFAYLGWRVLYGPDCYGWTDRVKRTIQNHVKYGLIKEGPDAGALSSLLDTPGGVFYNMNEVFLDHVRHYFDYTNDLDLMREIYPVLKGILAWEDRRLQPGGEDLYENALNTWISDAHWYVQGQCTQASAYMLGANTFMADIAARLGEDPAPYKEKAARIRAAMQRKLWMAKEGVFAEYLDTRGERMLHTEPELPTIYHSAEFGAADQTQIAAMLNWAGAHLRQESTPGGGKLYWSSNWYPNNGRSYTHSTYELAYGEEMNFALTQYLDGRADEAYRILRASLCGIYNGPTPGGLSCHSQVDGRQRANDEFADSISMWDRAVVEGLFGIMPKLPDGRIVLSPQLPSDWNEASIKTPLFEYTLKRGAGKLSINWKSTREVAVRLRMMDKVKKVACNGGEITFAADSAGWTCAESPKALGGTFEVAYDGVRQPAVEPQKPAERVITTVWSPPDTGRDLSRWTLVNLSALYNSTINDAMAKVLKEATPPPDGAGTVGFNYWKDHISSRLDPAPSDEAWRAKVGPDGVAWTADGLPFLSAKQGVNLAVVTRTGPFSPSVEFPVNVSGKTLYLMLTGVSFPTQSHVTHLRVTLTYADGSTEVHNLASPDGIGDCWSTWCNRWHDTPANGFENIGGRVGPKGSIEVQDRTKPVRLDTEAHLVPFTLLPKELKSAKVEAVANDIIFGLMGASVLR